MRSTRPTRRGRTTTASEPVGTIRSVADTSTRADKSAATRTRIASVALDLFVTNGYTETTVDQIAAAAGVARRTVFRHFPTKAAMLLDHLVLQREEAVAQLAARPGSEPPLASLLVLLRELAAHGYDRRLLTQIRLVLASQPDLVGAALWAGTGAFASDVVTILESRAGNRYSATEIEAVTMMALGWFVSAVNKFLLNDTASLAQCFDDVVTLCTEASTRALDS